MTQKQGIMSYSEQSCWLIIRVHTFTEHGGKGGKKREREKRLIKSLGVPGVALVRVVVGWWQIDPFRPLWKNTTVDDATNPFPLIFFSCLDVFIDLNVFIYILTLPSVKKKKLCMCKLRTLNVNQSAIRCTLFLRIHSESPPPFFFFYRAG